MSERKDCHRAALVFNPICEEEGGLHLGVFFFTSVCERGRTTQGGIPILLDTRGGHFFFHQKLMSLR